MKKLIFYIAWMFPVLFACESRMPLVKECDFCGEVDDMPVVLHTLKSDNIIMQVDEADSFKPSQITERLALRQVFGFSKFRNNGNDVFYFIVNFFFHATC